MKKFFSNKKYIVLFVILTIFVTMFIFSNSLKNIDDSTSDSNWVIAFVTPFFEIFTDTEKIDMHYVVRKCAHLTEFAALGFSVSGLVEETKKKYNKTYYGAGLFYGLLIAVTDEYIQSFSDRTSSVKDVMIDFTGFVIGTLVCLFFYVIIRRTSRKK
ncbi:MAG: hypothetical protein E7388_06055 [Ruminococcaceae bacterium]|nr:hypothetical protein [Oscillospiraceae bacterium]